MRRLVLVGLSGFGRETAEAVRAVNEKEPTWDLLGFVDDAERLWGQAVDGLPVIGPVSRVDELPDADVVLCTGSPRDFSSRRRLADRLTLDASRYATVIHPAAVIPPSTTVGPGTVILATTVATSNARIGAHVAIMPGVVITHDDVIDDYATLGAGVRLAGGVVVGEGAYVGSGALVRENLAVGPRSLVGMGAVVLCDVPEAEVWVGAPARRLRSAVAADPAPVS